MNNTYRVPSKEFRDFQAFQRREVADSLKRWWISPMNTAKKP